MSNNNNNSPPLPPTDMSAKVGGRIFQPALPVIDGAPPTALEEGFQQTLETFITGKKKKKNNNNNKDNNNNNEKKNDDDSGGENSGGIPLETKTGIETRERVLNQMGQLCREWIRYVCLQKGLPRDVVEIAGGQLFTSGSYRLGVHEPGADIDTILVAPGGMFCFCCCFIVVFVVVVFVCSLFVFVGK